MDRRKRIEYLVTTMCVLVTSFVIYGLVGSIEPIIQNSRLKSFLLFGCLGGFGFSMLVSTLILSARFFSNRGLGFKNVAAILWPVTYACAIYVGVFSYIPYQIYNVIKIITKSKKNNKDIFIFVLLIFQHISVYFSGILYSYKAKICLQVKKYKLI